MTSCSRIYVAGDGASIGGAKAAEYAGQLSAGDILLQLKLVDQKKRDALTREPGKALHRDLVVRPFLDALPMRTPLDEHVMLVATAFHASFQ